jgi:hypothetical protein
LKENGGEIMRKIEVVVKKYFAGLRYEGYTVKFPEGGMINFRISKYMLKDPKQETM